MPLDLLRLISSFVTKLRQEFERKPKRRGYTDPTPPPPEENVAQPFFTPNGGDFLDETDPISITSATPGATIYYTDDGSIPDESDTEYTTPLTLTETTLLRAKAFKTGLNPSAITGAQFNVTESPVGSWDERSMRDLPPATFDWNGPPSGASVVYIDLPVAQGGIGSALGTGTINSPVLTLPQAAALLPSGGYILIRDGVYFWSGTSQIVLTQPNLTIASYPGERAWIHLGGEPYREFYDDFANAWEPVVGGAPDEYRSTSPFTYAANIGVHGVFAESMVPIQGVNQLLLEAETELCTGSPSSLDTPWYPGPCMYYNATDDRIHFRASHTTLSFLETSDYAGFGGDYNYTGATDPRTFPILVTRHESGVATSRIKLGNNTTIKHLVISGGSPNFLLTGNTGIVFDNVWSYGAGGQATNCPGIQVINSFFRGRAAPWSNRASMKYQGAANYCLIIDNCPDFVLDRNEFTDSHDGVRVEFSSATEYGDWQISRNLIDNMNDDALIIPTAEYSGTKGIFLNLVRGFVTCISDNGTVLPESLVEEVFIYDNLFDMRRGANGQPPKVSVNDMNLYYGRGGVLSATPGEGGLFRFSHTNPPVPEQDVGRAGSALYHNIILVQSIRPGNGWLGIAAGHNDVVSWVKNNLFLQVDGSMDFSSDDVETGIFTHDNNGYWTLNGTITGAEPNSVYEDPELLNWNTNRFNPNEDLRLHSFSPLRGAAADTGSRPRAIPTHADIGALPYGIDPVPGTPFDITQVFGPGSVY